MERTIPDAWRARAPAMRQGAWDGLRRVLEHPHAPRYNQTLGDRVGERELEALAAFREVMRVRPREAAREPSSGTVRFVEALRERLFSLDALPLGFDVARDFEELPTTCRDDLARRLEDLVPRDAKLAEAIVYSTSATTGHAVIVPSHPSAMVQNLAHLEAAAAAHGVALTHAEGVPFALNATVQRETYVFATTMSGWSGAVFAKVNLAEHGWAGGAGSRRRFLEEFAPAFVASEPVTLAEAIALELPLAPKVVVSSAVHLSAAHAALITRAWGTKLVDLYSTTETGPIGVTVPGVEGHVVLVPDLFVEALDEHGGRVPDGARGELTVTGGRNPYLPLVRYRTGDHGRLGTVITPDGRPARVILDLEGRTPVAFVGARGERIGSVDIARLLRPIAAFVQHALHQRADGSLELRLRPLPGVPLPRADFEDALRSLFGRDARLEVVIDGMLGNANGKVVAWRCDVTRAGARPATQ